MFSRKKKFFVLSIALLCLSCLIFTGCGNRNNTQQTPSTNNNQTESTDQNGADSDASQGTDGTNSAENGDGQTGDTANGTDGDLHQRAEAIAKAVTSEVEQVKDARTVISDKLAYVSVEITETADTAQSASLKDEISQVVKQTDPDIETVYVMEDADTFTRMKEIGDDIADGKPISGFVEELENMFVRVTPTPQ